MPFLTFSNTDIQFAQKKLTWRFYTIAKALPTTKQVEIINKKKFTKIVLDKNVKAFVMHVTSLSLNSMSIYLVQKAQITLLVIEKVCIPTLDENIEAFVVHVTSFSLNLMPIHPAREVQIVLLVAKKVKIPTEYSNFLDISSKEKVSILPEVTKINQHAIELQKDQQLFYRSI